MTETLDAGRPDLAGLAIAIDVGGTFTDVVGMTASGRMALTKVPSTPADP